jgi:hypothetical protein
VPVWLEQAATRLSTTPRGTAIHHVRVLGLLTTNLLRIAEQKRSESRRRGFATVTSAALVGDPAAIVRRAVYSDHPTQTHGTALDER